MNPFKALVTVPGTSKGSGLTILSFELINSLVSSDALQNKESRHCVRRWSLQWGSQGKSLRVNI